MPIRRIAMGHVKSSDGPREEWRWAAMDRSFLARRRWVLVLIVMLMDLIFTYTDG